MDSSFINTVENLPVWRRWSPLAVWTVAVLLGLLIPLEILRQGYLPADDALRHVAKVYADKPWSDIVVLREGFAQDEHPGWHALLGAVQRVTGWDEDALVAFSVTAPFALYWLGLLLWRRRAEAMLAAVLIGCLAAPATFTRALFGRPYIVMMALTVILLQLWTKPKRLSLPLLLGTAGLFALAAWVHESWYLFLLLPAAFLLAGEGRKAFTLAGCWLVGVLVGATLTGHPLAYLQQTVAHVFVSLGGGSRDLRVTEFMPDPGDLMFLAFAGVVLVWRRGRGLATNPIFILAVLGWLLGLKISRFWTDWGFPAALLWLATEFEAALEDDAGSGAGGGLSRTRFAAVLLAAGAAIGVFLGITRDMGHRWTQDLDTVYLSPTDERLPKIAEWMPGDGGIIYSDTLTVFYRTFYRNPRAPWRYILGFEPGLMPPEELATLRDIQRRHGAPEAFQPWVKKLRPEDRFILLQGSRPTITELEWYYAGGDTWIGRLPRPGFGAH